VPLWAAAAIDWIEKALNSSFSIALIGGLTGAFAGAWGAQRVAERSKRREDLLRELRNTNAATMTAFSTCNAALALKKQHVLPMYEQFHRDKQALQEFLRRRAVGQVQTNAPFHFTADLRSFPALEVPIDTLKDLVFHRISAYGRPLALASVLDQSIIGLRSAIQQRDQTIQRIQDRVISSADLPNYYFGLPLSGGDTNQQYPDLVEAIHSYVDDVAFFSSLLCIDLPAHGDQVHALFLKSVGKGAPRVSKPDFAGPKASGLMPSDANYSDWLKAFVHADKPIDTRK
jgi:hypothetical protein